jgi:hypothetical protein
VSIEDDSLTLTASLSHQQDIYSYHRFIDHEARLSGIICGQAGRAAAGTVSLQWECTVHMYIHSRHNKFVANNTFLIYPSPLGSFSPLDY